MHKNIGMVFLVCKSTSEINFRNFQQNNHPFFFSPGLQTCATVFVDNLRDCPDFITDPEFLYIDFAEVLLNDSSNIANLSVACGMSKNFLSLFQNNLVLKQMQVYFMYSKTGL